MERRADPGSALPVALPAAVGPGRRPRRRSTVVAADAEEIVAARRRRGVRPPRPAGARVVGRLPRLRPRPRASSGSDARARRRSSALPDLASRPATMPAVDRPSGGSHGRRARRGAARLERRSTPRRAGARGVRRRLGRWTSSLDRARVRGRRAHDRRAHRGGRLLPGEPHPPARPATRRPTRSRCSARAREPATRRRTRAARAPAPATGSTSRRRPRRPSASSRGAAGTSRPARSRARRSTQRACARARRTGPRT